MIEAAGGRVAAEDFSSRHLAAALAELRAGRFRRPLLILLRERTVSDSSGRLVRSLMREGVGVP
ncbi:MULTISPECIES: hypothetical protein [unclassified Streptomyces]|uniref:hypothetical protein n=1 Tax=unclassified Streptomyces TaxID=2593676 RepID=UPI0036B9D904